MEWPMHCAKTKFLAMLLNQILNSGLKEKIDKRIAISVFASQSALISFHCRAAKKGFEVLCVLVGILECQILVFCSCISICFLLNRNAAHSTQSNNSTVNNQVPKNRFDSFSQSPRIARPGVVLICWRYVKETQAWRL